MLTLTEKQRNCTRLHRDATKLLIFSAIKIPQLLLQPTSHERQIEFQKQVAQISQRDLATHELL